MIAELASYLSHIHKTIVFDSLQLVHLLFPWLGSWLCFRNRMEMDRRRDGASNLSTNPCCQMYLHQLKTPAPRLLLVVPFNCWWWVLAHHNHTGKGSKHCLIRVTSMSHHIIIWFNSSKYVCFDCRSSAWPGNWWWQIIIPSIPTHEWLTFSKFLFFLGCQNNLLLLLLFFQWRVHFASLFVTHNCYPHQSHSTLNTQFVEFLFFLVVESFVSEYWVNWRSQWFY